MPSGSASCRIRRSTSSEALGAEQGEAERSQVRAFLRDRLTGTDLPYEVRGFVETAWADYLAQLYREHGAEGEPSVAAVKTLDDSCGASSPRSAPRRRRASPR